MIELKLPELGENIDKADVARVLVKPGDTVRAEQPLLELETDKATIEVPSPAAGTIERVLCKQGDTVKVGQIVVVIADGGAGTAEAKPEPRPEPKAATVATEAARQGPAPSEPEAQPRAAPPPPAPPPPERRTRPPEGPPVPAGPATRKLARELGVDVALVKGSGPHGRVTLEDVKGYVKANIGRAGAAPSAGAPAGEPPLPDFAHWGPIERQPLSKIRKKIAENMALAWRLCPQVTQYDEADVTDLEAGRKRYAKQLPEGAPKITMTVLAIKAVVAALKKFPQFNSSLDLASGDLVLKRHYHIGIAVDTENGLLVPVLRDAEKKTLVQLATELDDLSKRARAKKLAPDEMKGATFTITNLGGIGGTAFSPIVNWPEVAILGLARSREQMLVKAGQPAVRLVLPLCLSYDHRIIDGADGARFTAYVAQELADPVMLLMGV